MEIKVKMVTFEFPNYTKNIMKRYRIEFKWAAVFIVVSLLWVWLEKAVGLHDRYIDQHMFLSGLFAIPAVWIYVLALRDKKKNYYNRVMTFGQGFMSGFIITLILTILSPATQWVTSYVISPEYFSNAIEHAVLTGYFTSRAEAEAQFSFQNYVIQGLVATLSLGTVTSVVVALLLRSRRVREIG